MLRLWINSEEVELKEGEVIATTLQVNDVEKPDTFQSSFSNTFEIPATRANRKIFGNAQAIGDNNTRRTQLPCRLEDNGLPIVSNGFALINEITFDAYKITVYDGVADFFLQIGDRNLNQVNLDSINPSSWDLTEVTNNTQNTWSDGYVWALADYGYLDSNTVNVRYQYPSVFVKYLFQEIASQFTDYSFVSDGLYVDSFFESLLLPFHNNNKFGPAFQAGFLDLVSPKSYTSDVTDDTFIDYNILVTNEVDFDVSTGIADLTGNTEADRYTFSYGAAYTGLSLNNTTITIKIVGVNTSTVYATSTFVISVTSAGFVDECTTAFGVISEPILANITITFGGGSDSLAISAFSFTSENGQVTFGQEFPLFIGMPNIKIKDFLKDIWKAFGVVPKVDTYLKTISLQKFEDFSQDTPIDYSDNVDYSKEVIREDQYGSYAKTNKFKWGDGDQSPIGDGAFLVENALINEEYDWINLELEASESKTINDEFFVLILTILNDSNELVDTLSPRLTHIRYYSGSPIPSVNFTDGVSTNNNVDFSTLNFSESVTGQSLTFLSLQSTYHSEFIQMIQKMEKLTLFFNFNAKEFIQLDFFRPVYLSFRYKETQVIGKYLLRKIEDYKAGETAKCEFFKIN